MPTARFYVIEPNSNYASTTGYFELLAKLCGRATQDSGVADKPSTGATLSQRSRVSILTDEAMIDRIDKALWTHPRTGFLPHRVLGADRSNQPPAQIDLSTDLNSLEHPSVVINLTQEPVIHEHFTELVELVRPNQVSKARARMHFKAYKAQGYTLKHFSV